MSSFVKTGEEIERLRRSGARLSLVLEKVVAAARPRVSTLELDELAETLIRQEGGLPIFKGYGAEGGKPFPGTICASVNNEVVHGIPKKECVLQEGDILKIDIGMRFEGMVTDMARTIPIGSVSKEAERLMRVTEESLLAGIAAIRPGAKMLDYAAAVQKTAEDAGYSVVRDLVGHGVGHELHEDPQVPNYESKTLPNFTFEKGMTLALEPMINQGTFEVDLAKDDWTFITADGALSAHFEDTVLVTENGTEILTRPRI
jgi:methionyl aminopeptidase